MTTTTPTDRNLIQRLADAIDSGIPAARLRRSPLLAEARAYLDQPEPEGVNDETWEDFIKQVQHAQHVATREGECPRFDLVEMAFALWAEARAALALHGNQPTPIPLDECQPTEADCDAEGMYWTYHQWHHMDHGTFTEWKFAPINEGGSHWLPHWALPVPQPTVKN